MLIVDSMSAILTSQISSHCHLHVVLHKLIYDVLDFPTSMLIVDSMSAIWTSVVISHIDLYVVVVAHCSHFNVYHQWQRLVVHRPYVTISSSCCWAASLGSSMSWAGLPKLPNLKQADAVKRRLRWVPELLLCCFAWKL